MRRQVLKDCVVRLDERDDRIIGALQSNGRLTNVELARKVGMSESSCLRRTRALEDLGVIKGYAAVVDSKRAGYELIAFLMVDLDQRRELGVCARCGGVNEAASCPEKECPLRREAGK